MKLKPFATQRMGTPARWAGAAITAILAFSPLTGIGQAYAAPMQNLSGKAALKTKSVPGNTENFGKLPISFEPNLGQADGRVKYMAHLWGGSVMFQKDQLSFDLPASTGDKNDKGPGAITESGDTPGSNSLELRFIGANKHASIRPGAGLPGKVNYMVGKDRSQWRTKIPTYKGIIYHQLYRGVNLTYDGQGKRMKGTYHVKPGADASAIRWRYSPGTSVSLDDRGDLRVQIKSSSSSKEPGPTVTEEAPLAWQFAGGRRKPVEVKFRLHRDGSIGFGLGRYDHRIALTIDPALIYSTYLGGAGDDGTFAGTGSALGGIAVDKTGSAYITGSTASSNFPGTATSPIQSHLRGVVDAFIAKLNPTGSALSYVTYLGGDTPPTVAGAGQEQEQGIGIAVDEYGSAYVSGLTGSQTFPAAEPPPACSCPDTRNAFVVKLSPDGSQLEYSVLLRQAISNSIALGPSGVVYVAGQARQYFQTTSGGFQAGYGGGGSDAFVARIDPAGKGKVKVDYATFLGGAGEDRAAGVGVGPDGYPVIAGTSPIVDHLETKATGSFSPGTGACSGPYSACSAFVAKFDPSLSSLVSSTRIHGDDASSVAVGPSGDAFVTGITTSPDPQAGISFQQGVPGMRSAFVSRLQFDPSPDVKLVYSALLGGAGDTLAEHIAVDQDQNAYITGSTGAPTFPTKNSLQPGPNCKGGPILAPPDCYDAFVAELDPTGTSLLFSTFLGGNKYDGGSSLALDKDGNAYVYGSTSSTDFPIRPDPCGAGSGAECPIQKQNAGAKDVFVAKLCGTRCSIRTPPLATGPKISIAAQALPEGNLGSKSFQFPVTLTPPSVFTGPITVDFATADGTATIADQDYVPQRGKLAFLPGGPLTQMVSVPVVGDTKVEPDENFVVNLTNPSGGAVTNLRAVGTIINDDIDPLLPALSVGGVSLPEGDSGLKPFSFPVSLSASVPLSSPVTVAFSTADGTATAADSDYVPKTGTLTFLPGGALSQSIEVAVVGDKTVEPDETFLVNLSAAVNANIIKGQAVGVILDEDGAAPVAVLNPNQKVGGDVQKSSNQTSGNAPGAKQLQVQVQNQQQVQAQVHTQSQAAIQTQPGVAVQRDKEIQAQVERLTGGRHNVNLASRLQSTRAAGPSVLPGLLMTIALLALGTRRRSIGETAPQLARLQTPTRSRRLGPKPRHKRR